MCVCVRVCACVCVCVCVRVCVCVGGGGIVRDLPTRIYKYLQMWRASGIHSRLSRDAEMQRCRGSDAALTRCAVYAASRQPSSAAGAPAAAGTCPGLWRRGTLAGCPVQTTPSSAECADFAYSTDPTKPSSRSITTTTTTTATTIS